MVEKKRKGTYINYMKPKGRIVSDFGADLLDEARAKLQEVKKDMTVKDTRSKMTKEEAIKVLQKIKEEQINQALKTLKDAGYNLNKQEKAVLEKDRGKYYGDENFPVQGGQNVEDPEQFNEPPVFGAKYNRELRESSELLKSDFPNSAVEDMWGEIEKQKGKVKEWIADKYDDKDLKPSDYLSDFEIQIKNEALKKKQKIISDMQSGEWGIPDDKDDPIADFFERKKKTQNEVWDFVHDR